MCVDAVHSYRRMTSTSNLFMQPQDVLLERLEIVPFFVVRRDRISANECQPVIRTKLPDILTGQWAENRPDQRRYGSSFSSDFLVGQARPAGVLRELLILTSTLIYDAAQVTVAG